MDVLVQGYALTRPVPAVPIPPRVRDIQPQTSSRAPTLACPKSSARCHDRVALARESILSSAWARFPLLLFSRRIGEQTVARRRMNGFFRPSKGQHNSLSRVPDIIKNMVALTYQSVSFGTHEEDLKYIKVSHRITRIEGQEEGWA